MLQSNTRPSRTERLLESACTPIPSPSQKRSRSHPSGGDPPHQPRCLWRRAAPMVTPHGTNARVASLEVARFYLRAGRDTEAYPLLRGALYFTDPPSTTLIYLLRGDAHPLKTAGRACGKVVLGKDRGATPLSSKGDSSPHSR